MACPDAVLVLTPVKQAFNPAAYSAFKTLNGKGSVNV